MSLKQKINEEINFGGLFIFVSGIVLIFFEKTQILAPFLIGFGATTIFNKKR